MIATLLALSFAAAAPQPVEQHIVPAADTRTVADGEMGAMDRFFPFNIDGVDKRVDDAFLLTLIGEMCLPFGGLWMPLLVMKDAPEINTDIIISWLVPVLVTYAGVVLTSWTVVCWIPVWIVGGWVTTNATLKAYDRALKGKSIGGNAKKARYGKDEEAPGLEFAMAY
jgi:hypothetical protein